MAIIAALPKRATIHGDTIQVLPDITRDFSSDNYLNILRESGDLILRLRRSRIASLRGEYSLLPQCKRTVAICYERQYKRSLRDIKK